MSKIGKGEVSKIGKGEVMGDHLYRPQSRVSGILWQELGDELLVFDSERHRAHSLNPTSAAVWQACDGSRSVSEIAAQCRLEEPVVALALEQLQACWLLEGEPWAELEVVSRRSLLRRGAAVGAAVGFAVPVIRSITAPTLALAASTHKNALNGGNCFNAGNCSPGSECRSSTCERPVGATCFHSAVPANTSICSSAGGARPCPPAGVC